MGCAFYFYLNFYLLVLFFFGRGEGGGGDGGMSLCKTVNQLVSDFFFSEQLLAQRDKVEKTSKDDIKLWGKVICGQWQMWKVIEKEVLFIKPWYGEQKNAVLHRSIRMGDHRYYLRRQIPWLVQFKQILSQKTNTLISSVIAKSSYSFEIGLGHSWHYSSSYR